MSNDVTQVVTLHQEGGINCSQAIFSVYAKYFGLLEETAIKVASAFGDGMGGMGNLRCRNRGFYGTRANI